MLAEMKTNFTVLRKTSDSKNIVVNAELNKPPAV
jgi:hypothetical protein